MYSLPKIFTNREGKVCYDIKLEYLISYKSLLDKLEEENIIYYSDLYNKKIDEKLLRSLNKKIYNLIPIVEKRYRQVKINYSEKLKSILEHFEAMLSDDDLKSIDSYIYNNEEYKEYIFDKLKLVVEKNIIEKLKQNNKPVKIYELWSNLPEYFRDENYLKLILSKHENSICSYTLSDNTSIYITKNESIIEYLNKAHNSDDKKIEILNQRLKGDTLDTIGKNQNVTRERVRQILVKIKDSFDESNKYFFEDIYSYIFTEYDTSINDFSISLGDNGHIIYNYLDFRYVKGEKSINLLLDDDNVPVKLKKEFEKAIYKDYIKLGKDRVYK